MSDGLVNILDGNTFVVSDARGDIDASPDRYDRSVLVRHPLPVEVDPDGERRPAQLALGGRPAVLRDPVLPGAGHRHDLRRRDALGDPATRGRRRLPRGADHAQSRRQPIDLAVRIDADSDFADLFEVKDALAKKGQYVHDRVDDGASCSATSATRSETGDHDLASASATHRRERAELHRPASSRTSSGPPTSTWSPPPAPARTYAAQVRRGQAGRDQHGAGSLNGVASTTPALERLGPR